MKAASPLRQRFPFSGVLLAAICGILTASGFGTTWWLTGTLLLVWLVLLLFRKQGGCCLALTMTVFALLQLWSWNEAPARKLSDWLEEHPQDLSVEGIVFAEPKLSPSGAASFPLRVEKIEEPGGSEEGGSSDGGGKLLTLPVTVQVRWSGETPLYGDRLRFQATATRPPPPRNPGSFDYRYWLERHGIFTEFRIDPSEPGTVLSHGHGNRVMAWAIGMRHRMEAILSTDLEGDPRVLSAIKGITLGVTENAPEGFTDDFRFTGTMHLFAVSGLHVGMLAVIIWFVLKAVRLPRPWAVAVTIPTLFFYVAVTGLKSGSIRSAVMASILLCGAVLYRRSPPFNILAAAAFLQLALDTNALFSAGWQFSYSVVFAILAVAPPLEEWVRGLHAPDPFLPPQLLTRREHWEYDAWKYLAGLLSVSTAAWIGSLIPTVAYFHLVSFSAIGANLLAVPLAFGVLSLGALSLLSGSVSLWVAGAFNNANWLVTKLLLIVIQGSALLPGGHWFVGPPGKPYPVMTVFDLGGASCSVIREGRSCALLDAGRRRDAVRTVLPFLESSGVNGIASALMTTSDAAHLGGLSGIQRELRIERLAFPGSNGRSSFAKGVTGSLPVAKNSPQRLHAGESWSLLSGVSAEPLNAGLENENTLLPMLLHLGNLPVLFLPHLTPGIARRLIVTMPAEALHAEVLIVPLGGSELLSTLEVIRKIAPKVVISPVDGFNRNGVPSREWESLLEGEGITLLREDETGALTISADPKNTVVIPFLQKGRTISL